MSKKTLIFLSTVLLLCAFIGHVPSAFASDIYSGTIDFQGLELIDLSNSNTDPLAALLQQNQAASTTKQPDVITPYVPNTITVGPGEQFNSSEDITAHLIVNNGQVQIDGSFYPEYLYPENDGSTPTDPSTATKLGIDAQGDNAKVIINKDAHAPINASEKAEIILNGETYGNINADSDALIQITGNSSSSITAGNGAKVQIGGNSNSNVQILSGSEVTISRNQLASVTVMGEGSFLTVGNNVIGFPGAFTNSATITISDGAKAYIGGNIDYSTSIFGTKTNTKNIGISISGEGSEVTVEGDVHASVSGVTAKDSSNVTIKGNVDSEEDGIISTNSDVFVDGNVFAGDIGITDSNSAWHKIGLGLYLPTEEGTVLHEGTVEVNGNVFADKIGLSTSDGGNTLIHGNVTGGLTGIEISFERPDDKHSTVVVEGVVSGTRKALELRMEKGVNADDIITTLPQIIVQTLESENDLVVVTSLEATKEERLAIMDALIQNIYYIVDPSGIDQQKIAIYGTEEVDGYLVAREESTLTLKSTQDGYILCNVEAGKYADVQEKEDGSYTVTVKRGGDLNLKADVKEKTAVQTSASEEVQGDNSQQVTGSNDQPYAQAEGTETIENDAKTEDNSNQTNPAVITDSNVQTTGEGNGDNTQNSSGSNEEPENTANVQNPSVAETNNRSLFPFTSGLNFTTFEPFTFAETSNDQWYQRDPVQNQQPAPAPAAQNNQVRSWDPAFVLSPDYINMQLVVNLLGRQEVEVQKSDLISFRSLGFETTNIVMDNNSFRISMNDLIELLGDANQCMFVNSGNAMQVQIMGKVVLSVASVPKGPELKKVAFTQESRKEEKPPMTGNISSDNNLADQLVKLADLYKEGLLTEEQFEAAKMKLLGLET